ncbi:hypothetical protein ABES02_28505 [Neobacillus pocheonensis]|uniref:hypothetical protein n=1 Tax=Neobacillus pocheonensis TaxID=363869 RepID=UPI003D28EC96
MRKHILHENYTRISLKHAEKIIRETGNFQGTLKYRNDYSTFSTDEHPQAKTIEQKIAVMNDIIARRGDCRGKGVTIWLPNKKGQLQKVSIAQIRSFVRNTGNWEGYFCPNKVNPANTALFDPSWQRSFFRDSSTGNVLLLTASGSYFDALRYPLDKVVKDFQTSFCSKELGQNVTFWRILE